MSFEGVSKRVEMSMSLTAANEIVNWLSNENNIDTWTLSKMAILFTVILVYIDSSWSSAQITEVYLEREGILKLLGITRQVSILAVARSATHAIFLICLCG
jgi:Na+-translocating ferredoxin:NAD+ oxidoreductase RnfA subunit